MPLMLALGVIAMAAAIVTPAFAAEAPLIPRADFFGNPSKAGGRLSPDGKWLAWLAPRNGVLNVWVAPLGAMDQAKPMLMVRSLLKRQSSWT